VSRSENGETEGEGATTTVGLESGVPPQVVAIIALVVFTLTYLFF